MARIKQSSSLAVDEIWQSVSLEERLELISKSHASGLISSIVTIFMVGSIAYGLDKISLLVVAFGCAFFTFPLFSSHTWRTGKPSLILAYLAVRTVARRYAYGFDLPNIDIILIYRAKMKPLYNSTEEEYSHKKRNFDSESSKSSSVPVWVVLMRSGILLLSEKSGGAKLEFVSPIVHDTNITEYTENLKFGEVACVLEGSGISKGKSVILKTKYKGAHYVFTKRFQQLVLECAKAQQTLESLRKKDL